MFSFRMCQEPVRRQTTEGSSIEFIGYLIQQYEQNDCTVLFTRHQSTKVCRAFSDQLSRYSHLKLQQLKMCETCCVNGRHAKNMLNITISRHPLVYYYLWNVLAKSVTKIRRICIPYKFVQSGCIPPKIIREILAYKGS